MYATESYTLNALRYTPVVGVTRIDASHQLSLAGRIGLRRVSAEEKPEQISISF